MAGLDPAIHVFVPSGKSKTWMPGSNPGMTSQVNWLYPPFPAVSASMASNACLIART